MKNTLEQLHEQFIEKAQRPMTFGSLPIKAREQQGPVIVSDRWREVNDTLFKTYKFRRIEDRDTFIVNLLAYERSIEHNAEISIVQDQITLRLKTQDVNKVTSLDKEYARYADVLFRDLVYSPSYGT